MGLCTTHADAVSDTQCGRGPSMRCCPGPRVLMRSGTTHVNAVHEHTCHCGPEPLMLMRSVTTHAHANRGTHTDVVRDTYNAVRDHTCLCDLGPRMVPNLVREQACERGPVRDHTCPCGP